MWKVRLRDCHPWPLLIPAAQAIDRIALRVNPVEPWADAALSYHLPGKAYNFITRFHGRGAVDKC